MGEGTGVAQSIHRLRYGLDDRGSIPDRGDDENFSLRHRVLSGSGTQLASHRTGTEGSYSGGKAAGA
jgi:hypothetical protein